MNTSKLITAIIKAKEPHLEKMQATILTTNIVKAKSDLCKQRLVETTRMIERTLVRDHEPYSSW